MRLNYFIPVILGFLITSSCSKELKSNLEANHFQEQFVIPFEDALSTLENFMQDRGQLEQTKGSINSLVDDYFSVSALTTKAFDGEVNDVLYAVNFKDDGGFALLSADQRIKEEIIAVTEFGHISENDFGGTAWQDIASLISNASSEEELINLIDSGVLTITDKSINNACLIYASRQIEETYNDAWKYKIGSPCDPSGPGGNGRTYDNDNNYNSPSIIKYGPFIETKWGQNRPFNTLMEGYLVGCVPLAAAQIVFHHRNNLNIEPYFAGLKCNLDTIATVYHYTNWMKLTEKDTAQESNLKLAGTYTAQDQAAHFMLDIKNNSGMKINKESGFVWNAEDCLRHYGFKNVYHDFSFVGGSRHDQRHLDSVVESLKNEKPSDFNITHYYVHYEL